MACVALRASHAQAGSHRPARQARTPGLAAPAGAQRAPTLLLPCRRGDAKAKLAVTDSGSGAIHIYDMRR